MLKSSLNDVPKRIDALHAQVRELSRENESLQSKLSATFAAELTSSVKTVGGGTQLLAVAVQCGNMDALRSTADELKSKLPDAVLVLGAAMDDKVNFVVAVPQELVKKGFHVGKLVKEVAAVCGGGGGGRPDMAQVEAVKMPPSLAKRSLRLKSW